MTDNMDQLFGDYSPAIDSQYTTSPYDGLKSAAVNSVLAKGCNDNRCGSYNADEIKNATLWSDIIIVCLGTGTTRLFLKILQ